MARRLLILVAVFVLGAVFVVPSANAAFGIEKWESLTCNANEDTPEVGEAPIVGEPPLAKAAGQCTGATSGKFFTQAAGHPTAQTPAPTSPQHPAAQHPVAQPPAPAACPGCAARST